MDLFRVGHHAKKQSNHWHATCKILILYTTCNLIFTRSRINLLIGKCVFHNSGKSSMTKTFRSISITEKVYVHFVRIIRIRVVSGSFNRYFVSRKHSVIIFIWIRGLKALSRDSFDYARSGRIIRRRKTPWKDWVCCTEGSGSRATLDHGCSRDDASTTRLVVSSVHQQIGMKH